MQHRCGLVHKSVATLKLATHIVVYIVAQAIVEVDIQTEALVAHRAEQVTIDIGIWVSDDYHILGINGAILMVVLEDDIAGTKGLLVST